MIRHTGRASGRTYETPVVPHVVEGDYLIALPYGPGAAWVRNVLASGSATLVNEGRTVIIHSPEVVSTSQVARHLPPSEQRTLRIFGVDECLRVTAEVPAAPTAATPATPA